MSNSNSPPARVAVEGCGHGCLHDIYASVEKAATLKGWDRVDLLIIGGDFQAVRNSNDMACMSVPERYKEIGDFHEYYSGKRIAPYLTIFIGGNHEASNHLFELYHGGWVAPNIYYLGAANVVRFGPLRIAGFSGIWKGYDYRKPHFERIPYNREELGSIYHVREFDIRKLLQIRTQVDIGLSHDWPKQVEYSGDWQQLFSVKPFFREDSQNGRLGSPAAQYVLERLRPAYWFSAHLHVKFAASIQHGPQEHDVHKHQFGLDGASLTSMMFEEDGASSPHEHNQGVPRRDVPTYPQEEHREGGYVQPQETSQPTNENVLTATAQAAEPTETVQSQGDNENTPQLLSAWHNFHHVAAKNEAEENDRYLSEQSKNQGSTTPTVEHNLTWRKVEADHEGFGRKPVGVERSGPRETKKQKIQHDPQPVRNTDEIDLDLNSDSDLDPSEATAKVPSKTVTEQNKTVNALPAWSNTPPKDASKSADSEVPEDLRAQLPSSFIAPQTAPQHNQARDKLPFPEAITNKTTNFLALDKCLPNREFLQLLELKPVSVSESETQSQRPFRLEYDKEWLAITRVFNPDLQVGGEPSARNPQDKGEAVYKSLIEEQEKWVEEHIVKPGKLAIPEIFTPTAPVFDPEVPITTEDQPPEYNNPQTAAFCELVGIENKFFLSDEERDVRIQKGPRPCNPSYGRRGGRGGGFGGRGGGRGGSGRGRGYGGRGFGRGVGGGRRW
ncbi:RNA lariat debranching enzyme [Aspergillus undulatus]|uniref:RNA lariat debranching enzyme n=1 Tax=Aspergillus undulatus TaxID=1810928 RepID=UPI003CCCF6FF